MATAAALCVGAVLGRKNGQRTMDLCTSYDRVCTSLTDRVCGSIILYCIAR